MLYLHKEQNPEEQNVADKTREARVLENSEMLGCYKVQLPLVAAATWQTQKAHAIFWCFSKPCPG